MELRVPDELKGFYSLDRNIYIRLLRHGFDLNHSKLVVAFWYLVDQRNHYKFMAEKIKPIGDAEFNELANETLACLICLITDSNISRPSEFKRLCEAVPNFSLVLGNKEKAKRDMEWLVKEVYENAFGDIIQQYWLNGLQGTHNWPRYVLPSPAAKMANNQSFPSKQEIDWPPEERSLFFTFSKGHPVSREELETLIRGWNFEDRVEEIFMNPPLSARVVCKSPTDVRKIVGDEEGRPVHFSINAKDVRVRQWRPNVNGKDAPKRSHIDSSLPHQQGSSQVQSTF